MTGRRRVLAAVRTLLETRCWDEISLGDVAAQAGVSRQTIYNEFGSRSTLAALHVETLLENVLGEHLPDDVLRHLGETGVEAALARILQTWFAAVEADPWLQSDSGRRLLRGTVADETTFLADVSTRLAERYRGLAPDLPAADALRLARAVVRLSVSYLLVPAAPGEDPAGDVAAVLAPYAAQVIARPPGPRVPLLERPEERSILLDPARLTAWSGESYVARAADGQRPQAG